MISLSKILSYLKNHWLAFILLIAGLYSSVLQFYGADFGRLLGDYGDARFIISIVEYNYQWICGHYQHYWDGFFFYPDKEVISYSDNLLGISPLYFLIRIFSGDFLTAFQLLVIACHILNFAGAYLCLSKISGNRQAAALGAFIFAFSIGLYGIYNHPQFIFRFCIPWFFYYLYRYLKDPHLKLMLWAAFFLAFQFYLGIYLGLFLMLGGIFFAIAYLAVNYKQLRAYRSSILHLISSAGLFALLILPMLYFYYQRLSQTLFYADYEFYMQTIPRLSSWFHAFPGSLCWNFLSNANVNSSYHWLHYLFPGGIAMLAVVIGIYAAIKRKSMYLVLLLCLGLFLAFGTYYNGHTMYGFVMKLPGIKTVRVVSRYITVLLFFLSWLCTLQFAALFRKYQKQGLILGCFFGILIIADNYCFPDEFKTFSKKECHERVDKLAEKVKVQPGFQKRAAFAYIPGISENSIHYHIDAMLCALQLQTKTVNGYSSSCNKDFGPFWNMPDSLNLENWCRATNTDIKSLIIVK